MRLGDYRRMRLVDAKIIDVYSQTKTAYLSSGKFEYESNDFTVVEINKQRMILSGKYGHVGDVFSIQVSGSGKDFPKVNL